MESVVVFSLDGQHIGLSLGAVERAVRVVDVTPLPKAPPVVQGVVNIQGRILPVINLRRRFGLSERDVLLSDQLLIVRSATRVVALIVDAVTEVVDYSAQDFLAADAVVPGMEYVKGIVRLPDGVIVVQDVDRFLSLDEAQALDEVMAHG